MAASIDALKAQSTKKMSVFSDIATAIKARERGMFPLGFEAAKALTERGVKKVSGGYHCSTDQRLLAPSAIKLLPKQVAAFAGRISCPITLILAVNGLPKCYPNFESTLAKYPKIKTHMLSGGHHLHMEQEAASVAVILNSFFTHVAT